VRAGVETYIRGGAFKQGSTVSSYQLLRLEIERAEVEWVTANTRFDDPPPTAGLNSAYPIVPRPLRIPGQSLLPEYVEITQQFPLYHSSAPAYQAAFLVEGAADDQLSTLLRRAFRESSRPEELVSNPSFQAAARSVFPSEAAPRLEETPDPEDGSIIRSIVLPHSLNTFQADNALRTFEEAAFRSDRRGLLDDWILDFER
jgi:hypothetical protein